MEEVVDAGLDFLHSGDQDVFFFSGRSLGGELLSGGLQGRQTAALSKTFQNKHAKNSTFDSIVLNDQGKKVRLSVTVWRISMRTKKSGFSRYLSVLTAILSSVFLLSSIMGRTFDTGGLADFCPSSDSVILASGATGLHRGQTFIFLMHILVARLTISRWGIWSNIKVIAC